MPRTDALRKLAVNGGPKAIESLTPPDPKVKIEELLELLDLWRIPEDAKREIEAIARRRSKGAPHLFRYYAPGESKVQVLEREFAERFGCKYALAVNSGTSALIAALVACGVGPGAEVIVPAHTFFATCAAVVVAKAIPVLAEIDDSLTLDPADFERKITPRTKAVIPVHMSGKPADMDAIMRIARAHDIKVIEDTAQADGASYKGKRLGTIGDIGCYSLDFYKIMASGEGGIIATDDEYLYIRAQSYHDTAACWRPERYARERMPGELFCGENYRMSELQGAVALAQLRRVDEVLSRLRENKKRIASALEQFPGVRECKLNDPEGDAGTNVILILPDADMKNKVREALSAEGLPAHGFSQQVRDWHVYNFWEHILEKKTATDEGCPFTCPYYDGPTPEYSADMCPQTLDYIARSLWIGVSPDYTPEDCRAVAGAVNKVLGAFLS